MKHDCLLFPCVWWLPCFNDLRNITYTCSLNSSSKSFIIQFDMPLALLLLPYNFHLFLFSFSIVRSFILCCIVCTILLYFNFIFFSKYCLEGTIYYFTFHSSLIKVFSLWLIRCIISLTRIFPFYTNVIKLLYPCFPLYVFKD